MKSKFKRPFDKEDIKQLLIQTPEIVELKNINSSTEGRIQIKTDGVIFESFILNSIRKKLYVFLSAVGNPDTGYPRFHRPTWSKIFNGVCLFIDDPARQMGKYSPAFYVGNEEINVLDLLKKIINKVQDVYGIASKDVCFISSSNGGYASLFLGDAIKDSRVIALNPIISISRYLRSVKKVDAFEKAFGIKLDSTDKQILNRTQVFRIIDNKRSRFFIYSNIASRTDKIVIEGLFRKLNLPYKLGLNVINNNLWVWIVDIHSANPHLAQPNEFIVKKIEEILDDGIVNEEVLNKEFWGLCEEVVKEFRMDKNENI